MAETVLALTVSTGRESRPVDGGDSITFPMPSEYYVDIDGKPVLVLIQFMRLLRALADETAAGLNCVLHHADFWVTKDPELMKEKGTMHDCPDCQDGMARTLAQMSMHPDVEWVVGQCWWAG